MTQDPPSIQVVKQIDLGNLDAKPELFADDVVWHYHNPNLPDVTGDYIGLEGIKAFFRKVAALSKGTFRVDPQSIIPIGNELVFVHVRDILTIDGKKIALDVVVVWRIVDGQVREVWDIVPTEAEVLT
ncbi:MAG: nuclear transport factor 2 family protein [Sulfitobacter sp.]|nr:nuclear transport factor 2 family protein [Sulfitobacter sp.]